MFRAYWPFYVSALVFSYLLVWGAEQIVVARGFKLFAQRLDSSAARLADGRNKSLILGATIAAGRFDPFINNTAQGILRPDNPVVRDSLMRTQQTFSLSAILVLDRQGRVVAYQGDSNKSAIGLDASFRPYFRAAMTGTPNMYPAQGVVSNERGFFIAAPVIDSRSEVVELSDTPAGAPQLAATAPEKIHGVVAAVLGFDEVDQQLERESVPLAVVSPEGVIFSTNVAAWHFMRLDDHAEAAPDGSRIGRGFKISALRRLDVDGDGWIRENGHSLKMVSAPIDWRDPKGDWRLIGFADPYHSFSLSERLAVGALGFIVFVLVGGWWLARQNAQRKTEQVRNLLDNAGEGFLSFGPDLVIDDAFSHSCESLLGCSPAGRKVCEVFFDDDEVNAALVCSIIPAALAAADPTIRASMLSLLPREIQRGALLLRADYKIIENRRFMVVLANITEERLLAAQLDSERRRLELIVIAVSDSRNFFDTTDSFRAFVAQDLPHMLAGTAPPPSLAKALYRELHTYKGLLGQLSFTHTAKALHECETRLSGLLSGSVTPTAQQLAESASPPTLEAAFAADIAVLTDALGEEFLAHGESIVLSHAQALQLEKLAIRLLRGEPVDASVAEIRRLLNALGTLRKVPWNDVLMGFDSLVRQAAERMEKDVAPIEVIGGADVWIDPHEYRAFLRSLVHVFRNAVAHGIETPEGRWAADKDEAGKISCRVAQNQDSIELSIADDGAGIDLAALRDKAVAAGIYTAGDVQAIADPEIARLIFIDNISTQHEISELAGRGIGLAAVLNETIKLGGEVVVNTVFGQGTEFVFSLPLLAASETVKP